MKQNLANPFLIEKYFDEVRLKKMPVQDAVNLMNVLMENKTEMFRMIKNAGQKFLVYFWIVISIILPLPLNDSFLCRCDQCQRSTYEMFKVLRRIDEIEGNE